VLVVVVLAEVVVELAATVVVVVGLGPGGGGTHAATTIPNTPMKAALLRCICRAPSHSAASDQPDRTERHQARPAGLPKATEPQAKSFLLAAQNPRAKCPLSPNAVALPQSVNVSPLPGDGQLAGRAQRSRGNDDGDS